MTLNCQEKKAICHKVFSPIEYSCTQCASPLLPEKTPWKPRNTFISYLTHVCNPVWDHEMHNHMYNKATWFSSIQLFTKSKMTSWYVCSDPSNSSFSLNLLYVRCPRLWLKMVPSVCSTSWEDSPESSYVLQLHLQLQLHWTILMLMLLDQPVRVDWQGQLDCENTLRKVTQTGVNCHEYSFVLRPANLRFCELLWLDSSKASSISFISWESPDIHH